MSTIWSSADSTLNWQIANLHGDIVATIHGNDSGLTTVRGYDEYGVPHTSTAGDEGYAWLGSTGRATDPSAGMVLMGVRLYNPTTGRFLQADRIFGGNANAYTYPADPINSLDIDGQVAIAIPAAVLGGGAIAAAAAVIAFMAAFITVCAVVGCTVTVPTTKVKVPWPSSNSKTAKKNRNTKYKVYKIFNLRTGSIWKYGITKNGAGRPKEQLDKCSKYYSSYSACGYTWVKENVKGYFQDRLWEAAFVTLYVYKHKHCPPVQLKSCS
ncbi:hypothetical protein JMF97_29865 [Micromonospora fiedleri]|uniref:RHS repeat-associated core domain-containing protein n=1 Tax=Micromonospora fiedleri TaxID=1157498 RepID=A0ABS1UX00_9ACTN|nr:RHS repeat-associated core domain-containing protein [Micromonospora fiedleri]MBL6280374.1 hypothetical protein [Micromonospora fiedleri]